MVTLILTGIAPQYLYINDTDPTALYTRLDRCITVELDSHYLLKQLVQQRALSPPTRTVHIFTVAPRPFCPLRLTHTSP
jgi:hypothetical protein